MDRLRRRALPWAIWFALVAGAYVAWEGMGVGTTVRGFAEALPYRLSSVEPARVESLLVAIGDRVEAGQVLAILDARALEGELRAVVAERARVLAEIDKAELEARAAFVDSRRGLAGNAAEIERAQREAKTRLETARAELTAVTSELARRRQAVADGLMKATELAELEIRQAALKKHVAEEGAAVTLYASRSEASGALDTPALEDWVARTIEPLKRELEVHDGQARALEARRDQHVLRAPVDGQVIAVHGQRDSVVTPGLPLVELVTDAPGRIVACMEELGHAPIGVGVPARVRSANQQGPELVGSAVAVTPVIELPVRCWRDPRVPMWGRVVTVELEPKTHLVPGETFEVRFGPGG